MKALLKENWLEEYRNFWKQGNDPTAYHEDEKFIALAERINKNGLEIEVVFTGPDAFEKEDNNYWLPDICFERLEKEQ